MIEKREVEINGKPLIVETGRYARQADGAVMVRYGDTMVLVTAVSDHKPNDDIDYFPLQVEFREKLSAAGKFPGGFIKREGRPSEKEILSARLIDRPIRPLFPEGYKNETQIIATVFSSDGQNDADVLAAVGASAALTISDIPFEQPIAEIRVGRKDGEFIANPTMDILDECDLELVVAGSEESIMMVEGEAKEVSEDVLLDALEFAHVELKKIIEMIKQLRETVGREKRELVTAEVDQTMIDEVKAEAETLMNDVFKEPLAKQERNSRKRAAVESIMEKFEEKYPEKEKAIAGIIDDVVSNILRGKIIKDGLRIDGRKTDEIRPITIDLGMLPRTHGSALFTRGETQSLTTLTLGTKNDEQMVDGLYGEESKRFTLHYNFPPYSVGETGRMFGPGRREIGHGNLAERSLKRFIPDDIDFPYTIRLLSDILESNGSSSMATVCAGSLALMDGGVKLPKAVAGIAMGLIMDGDNYAVLSDILGDEDHHGDMDFKVAGTADGVTAFQMDIKISGVSFEIMKTALGQAKEGRLKILNIMNEAISQSRDDISKFAPRLVSMNIDPELIGSIIGPGGKTIQKMQRDFGVEISIEENGDVKIASIDGDSALKCKAHIERMTEKPEVGKIYDGTVVKLMDFGAIVEFLPGKTGLMHISEIDFKHVKDVKEYYKEGDEVRTKLLKIDNGKFSLSRKAVLREENKKKEENKDKEENNS